MGMEGRKASLIPSPEQSRGYGRKKSKRDTQTKAEQWVCEGEK